MKLTASVVHVNKLLPGVSIEQVLNVNQVFLILAEVSQLDKCLTECLMISFLVLCELLNNRFKGLVTGELILKHNVTSREDLLVEVIVQLGIL